MRPSHSFKVYLIGRAAVLAWIAGFAASAPALAQFTSAPGDSRYYAPPVADAPSDPTPGEPLLSYRRDDAITSDDSTAPAEPPTRFAAAPQLAGDVNPLRKSPEPLQETPPANPMATLPAAPVSEPLTTQPSTEDATKVEGESTPAVVSNPFPEVMLPAPATQPAAAPQAIEPLIRYDAAVSLASHEPAEAANTEPAATPLVKPTPHADALARRLAPPTSASTETASDADESKSNPLPIAFSKLESFSTAGAGLAIVVGLFLICVWMLRRGGAKTSGALPTDAFAVLGRAPLTAQSFAHLLRLGNKLVLVAISPDGIQPLTEVTDPMEVDRLTGLCASGRGHGPSAEFQQVLAQLSREPARGFLGSEAAEPRRR